MIEHRLQGKFKFFQWLLILVFVLLGCRLVTLQLLESNVYKTKAELNQFRFLAIRAPRGEIVDCDGKVLAGNKIVNTISLVRQDLEEEVLEQTISNLIALLQDFYPEITKSYIKERLSQQPKVYEPVVIKRDIPIEVVSCLEERRKDLPGVVIGEEVVRIYPEGSLAGHLLGYVGEISAEELSKYSSTEYKLGDIIGKSGLELEYEKNLKGQDGFRQVEVDAWGRPIPHKDLIEVAPVSGNKLVLTIDQELQKTLEKSLDTVIKDVRKKQPLAKAGAAVLLNVKTGAVLAASSRPTFDPNELVPPRSTAVLTKYINPPADAQSPMLNRVIGSRYPPGSTFKPITGMAALEEGVIGLDEEINCKGSYWIKPYHECWDVHGNVNFFKAMARSCNVFFIEAGRRAGAEAIVRVARDFGLDHRTGIDLPGEINSILASPEKKRLENDAFCKKWYDNKKAELEEKYTSLLKGATVKEREKILADKQEEERILKSEYQIKYNFETAWQPYDTFNMAIGQGQNEFTPLHLANYVATLANNGKCMQPYIVQRIENHQGRVIAEFGPQIDHNVDVSQATMESVRQAMAQVCKPGGTAYWLFSEFPVQVAAKTGTAESGRGKDLYHGIFIAFAPADDPEIAFAGVIEYGYHGSESTGIIARDVLAKYFGLEEEKEEGPVAEVVESNSNANQTIPADTNDINQETIPPSNKPEQENSSSQEQPAENNDSNQESPEDLQQPVEGESPP